MGGWYAPRLYFGRLSPIQQRHPSCLKAKRASFHLKFCMKRTYQPSKIRRKRQHGFLSRTRSTSGRGILNARRRAGRKRLTPA